MGKYDIKQILNQEIKKSRGNKPQQDTADEKIKLVLFRNNRFTI
jgi:hypothetical protein